MSDTPRPYQIEGRDFLAPRKVALLADEMRVGKTPQAILAAHKAGAQSILVACPAIAVPHWNREFQRWWPGEALPRLKIMSYEKATRWFEEGLSGTLDLFIPDEAHFAKNPEAKRTKMVYGKGGFAWRSGATWALSGTPAPKHAAELWPILRAFGVVGMSYGDFIKRYCTVDWMSGKPNGTKVEMIPELKALLAKVMLRRTRKQVAPDMPDIGFDFLEVKIGADLNNLPAGASDYEVLEYLSSHQSTCKEDRVSVALAKAKVLVDEIEFVIDNGLLKQTVVFGWHTEPLSWLTTALRSRGLEVGIITGGTVASVRERIQQDFRVGRCQVICANILAAGTAIDLSAASHGYFLELDWVPGNNAQAANRLISMEKEEKVTFDVVTWPGSTDDRVQKILLRRVSELSKLI